MAIRNAAMFPCFSQIARFLRLVGILARTADKFAIRAGLFWPAEKTNLTRSVEDVYGGPSKYQDGNSN